MLIAHSKASPATVEADVLVVPLYTDDAATRSPLRELDRAAQGVLGAALERGELSGKPCEVTPWSGDGLGARLVLFVGAGARAEADAGRMRRVAAVAARHVRSRATHVALVARADAHVGALVEGFSAGEYESDLYRTQRSAGRVQTLTVLAGGNQRAAIARAEAVAEATTLCRDLVNEPPNELTPTRLAERATEALKPVGVKVRVLRGAQLAKFGGLLGVARGSAEPPVFVSMAWEPPRARTVPVLGLVGKGVTFDSGGLSLKPADAMTWMKGDMAGAAAVIAAMRAIAVLKVPITVRAVVPATENMPSGTATRVGDVLRLYSGKTAEILNTDAEGRLILHDALAWLAEQGVTHMVDAATLTGAVEIALGNVSIGVMGRPDRFVDRVLRAARAAGERCWPLPLYPEYREQIESDIADLKNVGGRPAGTITAAWFLAEAVPDTIEWAHLDIAATAWSEGKPDRAPGATGSGVAAFVRLAQDMAGRA